MKFIFLIIIIIIQLNRAQSQVTWLLSLLHSWILEQLSAQQLAMCVLCQAEQASLLHFLLGFGTKM